MKRYLYLLVFFILTSKLGAQHTYLGGILPCINLNTDLKNNFQINGRIESRIQVQQGEFGGSSQQKNQYLLSDFVLNLAKKTSVSSTVSVGYLLRVTSQQTNHRFIQQFTKLKKYGSLRFSHRITTDQTLIKAQNPIFRLRYRASLEVPLNGETVDQQEFYLRLNNEYLSAYQHPDFDLEIRMIPLVGYQVNQSNKLEWGLDYRINSFLAKTPRSSFWVALNWFYRI